MFGVDGRHLPDPVPSGADVSLACRRETPGSAGGPVRSISGLPWEVLRRPIQASVPVSGKRRTGTCSGKLIDAASAESSTAMLSK